LISGHVQAPDNVPELLHGQVFGIAEDKNGWFWIATANHVLAVRRDKLIAGRVGASDLREYGSEDGLLSNEGVKRNNSVISDASGRIWFSLSRGLSVTDPSHLAADSAPAITHVEGISADGSPLDSRDLIRVPASRKRITFAYTGLSLAAPERVRFRYFLEGFDRAWSEPVANREAVYTNLNAGRYRFRLAACNSDGMWNGAETSIQFEIEPVFWKTWWFGLSSLTVFLGLLWTLHQLRLRQLQNQFNVGLEARVGERTRIARELHDTLLQSLHGLMFQYQAARNMLPKRPQEAIQTLDGAISATEQAIAESRSAIHDLRTDAVCNGDLGESLKAAAQELADSKHLDSPAPMFQMIVEGERKPLPQVLHDEVYRIAHELLRNAFQHAHADRIEVEIRYNEQALRLRIRDNGNGIDPKVLKEGGSSGHWGLRGVRERVRQIGAQLDFWSEAGAGTEVQLSIPAAVAYVASSNSAKRKRTGNKTVPGS
jgi:signal transduction histidine kinase